MGIYLWFQGKREGQEQDVLKSLSESLTTFASIAKLSYVAARNQETLCSKLSDLLSFTGTPRLTQTLKKT